MFAGHLLGACMPARTHSSKRAESKTRDIHTHYKHRGYILVREHNLVREHILVRERRARQGTYINTTHIEGTF